jgi:hypothetical protein
MATSKYSSTRSLTDKSAHMHAYYDIIDKNERKPHAGSRCLNQTLRHHARLDPEAEARGWGDT